MSDRDSHIRITERNGVRTLRFEHAQQSSMRLDDPFETDFEYPAYMHITVAVVPEARSALFVGLGGGTLVKRFWRDYAPMHIDVAEIDPDIVEVARTQFALPDDERIRVSVADGRRFLESSSASWDIIIIDAYDDDHVPRHLLTQEFMRLVRDHLSENGVVAYNVTGSLTGFKSRAFRSFHRTISSVWRRAWVFPVMLSTDGKPPGHERNLIVLATDADVTTDVLLERVVSRVDGRVSVRGFPLLGEDLYKGKLRTGDVPLLTDPAGWRHRR